MGKSKKSTVPRKASRGMGASHRRHGTGGGMRSKAGVLWRPPENLQGLRGALAELGQRPKGCECDGVGTCSEHRERKVESMRGKRVKRAATHRVNIASHGSKGSFILNDGIRSYGWLDNLLDRLGCKVTVIIDSCYSGSALPHLGQAGREVYVACGADEVSTGEYARRFAEALGGVEADVDGDGVVEMWEANAFSKHNQTVPKSIKYINLFRYIWDFEPDTDGDGWQDWEEIYCGNNPKNSSDHPTDWDGDTLPDYFENKIPDLKYDTCYSNSNRTRDDRDDLEEYHGNKNDGVSTKAEWYMSCIWPDEVKETALYETDVYIEIDWMQGCEPKCLGDIDHWTSQIAFHAYFNCRSSGIAAFIGMLTCVALLVTIPVSILFLLMAVLFIGLAFIIEQVWKEDITLQEIYEEEGINLHIDDGCMGGGGDVVAKNSDGTYLKYTNGSNNDVYDYMFGNGWDNGDQKIHHYDDTFNGHFNFSRFRIFHYSLFVSNALDEDGDKHCGISDYGANTFLVGTDNWKQVTAKYTSWLSGWIAPYLNKKTMEATLFMHELGHNFELEYKDGLIDIDGEGYTPYGSFSCMNYYYLFSCTDYTSNEWDSLDTDFYARTDLEG